MEAPILLFFPVYFGTFSIIRNNKYIQKHQKWKTQGKMRKEYFSPRRDGEKDTHTGSLRAKAWSWNSYSTTRAHVYFIFLLIKYDLF